MSTMRRTIRIMLSLYKTLVRPHVEYCFCAWNLYYSKDKELLEKIQHNYTKNDNEYARQGKIDYGAQGFGPLKSGETGRILLRFSKCTGSLVTFCFMNLLRWMTTVRVQEGTHANWLVPVHGDITMYFFSNKVINRWKLLDQRTVDATSINAFKSRLV